MRATRAGLPLVLTVAALVAACDQSTTGPTPPPVGTPQITCPANVTVTSAASQTPVVYTAPAQTGGVPPVTVTCTPASGAMFAVGNTSVNCNAKDAVGQAATCTFRVTVTSFTLGAVRFMAFGDSLTAGENGDNNGTPDQFTPPASPACLSQTTSAFVARARPQIIDLAHAYPTDLKNALTAQFPSQSIAVYNEGNPGESAASGALRIGCTLNLDQPDAVLLLEGINDLYTAGDTASEQQQAIPGVVQNLASDIAAAYGRGIRYVFVSSLLPDTDCPAGQDPCRGQHVFPSIIVSANSQIAAKVRSLGAVFVDSYSAFIAKDPTIVTLPNDGVLINSDGLHATPAGYALLAQTFQTAILTTIPQTAAAGGRVLNVPARRR